MTNAAFAVRRLFYEPNGERILIELSFAGFYRRDDDEHRVQYPERNQDRNPDKENAENRGNCVINQHRYLEIQRFLSVRIDVRRVTTLNQPDDQGAQNVTEEVKKQPEQCAGVAQDAPRSNIRGSGWSWLRLLIHM